MVSQSEQRIGSSRLGCRGNGPTTDSNNMVPKQGAMENGVVMKEDPVTEGEPAMEGVPLSEDGPVSEGDPLSEDGAVAGADPVPDWPMCRRRRREMVRTHFFKMASKTFGFPRCKLRVSTAMRAPERAQPRLPARLPADQSLQEAEAEAEAPRSGLEAGGWSEAEYTEWLSARKRQRAELQVMENVRRWINSKLSANDLELRVLESLERQQRASRHKDSLGLSEPTPVEINTLQKEMELSSFYDIGLMMNLSSLEPEELLKENWDQEQRGSEDIFSSSKTEQKEKHSQDVFMQFDKDKLHYMDLMGKCLLVRGEKRTIACHSLPTTIAGEMGKANNVHRQRCLEEYKKILKMCQYYGISFTERMLEKALLHPGDKLKMEPGLKLRPPGTGLLPNHEVEKWVSTRRLIALEQLNRQLAEKKGEIQRESKLENITLKDVSQGTKLRKGHRKKKGSRTHAPSNKDQHMAFDDYVKFKRKLKVKAQSVPGLTPSAQANPYAFWPGHLLDKVRMYLPYATLEHQEVFFSNTQDARLSPYRYYSNNSWPVSKQGYLTYGDIDMHKRYWL
ncbi:uncharacterized protein [Chiloscyllium punctatum]|uniref:uncharacterized protein n=1 Tax=Chiloscyllium punctatum TaxID=137246 RepID=UPI003B641F2C